MKIDRTLFLALCGTIASGAACKQTATTTTVPILDIGSVGSAMPAPPPVVEAPASEAAAKCDDSIGGDGPSCEALQSEDPSCAPFEFPHTQCYGFTPLLKPRLASAFVTCLAKLTPRELCDATNTYKCKNEVIRMACRDSSASDYCAAENPGIEGEDRARCIEYASGLNTEGRHRLGGCHEEYGCIEGLLQEQ
jgi:hypothetical protein